jgi:hypothetical protein
MTINPTDALQQANQLCQDQQRLHQRLREQDVTLTTQQIKYMELLEEMRNFVKEGETEEQLTGAWRGSALVADLLGRCEALVVPQNVQEGGGGGDDVSGSGSEKEGDEGDEGEGSDGEQEQDNTALVPWDTALIPWDADRPNWLQVEKFCTSLDWDLSAIPEPSRALIQGIQQWAVNEVAEANKFEMAKLGAQLRELDQLVEANRVKAAEGESTAAEQKEIIDDVREKLATATAETKKFLEDQIEKQKAQKEQLETSTAALEHANDDRECLKKSLHKEKGKREKAEAALADLRLQVTITIIININHQPSPSPSLSPSPSPSP